MTNVVGPNNCIEDLEPPTTNDAMFQAGQIPTLQGWFSQDKNYPLIPTDGQLSITPFSHIYSKSVTENIVLVSDIPSTTLIHGGGGGGGGSGSATENLTTHGTPTRTMKKNIGVTENDLTTTIAAASVVKQSNLFPAGIVAPLVNPLPEVVGGSSPQVPTVTSYSPTTGTTLGGDSITINGTNFAAPIVNFGSMTGSVTSSNSTQIIVKTPAEAAGNVTVTVTTAGGIATASPQFTYQTPAPLPPTISSFSPSQGGTAGGTQVVIQGTNMSGTTAVLFGNVAATNLSSNATSVTCTAPAEALGSVFLKVTAPGGTATSTTQFTYVSTLPTIASFSPTQGTTLGGTQVTITGTNLTGVSSINFGGTAATNITANTATSVTCTTPVEGAGDVSITLVCTAGTVTSSGQYLYVAPSNSKPNILLVMMENNGQSTFYAGTSDTYGSLMSQFTYMGVISLGHYSASNYVQIYSGVNAHDPYIAGTQTGSQTIYTGGTTNPDYDLNLTDDNVDTTFNARTTIFDLLHTAGMSYYGYYDGTNTNTSPNYTPRGGYRDLLADFPRLSSAPVSLTYSVASNGNIVTGAGSLVELLTDPLVGLDIKKPNFAFVYPNNTNNGHNGIAAGNTFLNQLVTAVQTTNWYASGGIILVLTDEDELYGGGTTNATWVGLGNGPPTSQPNGGAGGFVWAISISNQTKVTGGLDLSSAYTVTSPSLTSAKTGNSTFEARTTHSGILATICSALGLNASSLSTAATAIAVPAFLPSPSSGGPGGGTGQENIPTTAVPSRSVVTHRSDSESYPVTTVPSGTKSSSSGGPPPLDSTSITVTDPAGNHISMTAVYTQTFPGTTAPWPTGDWFAGTPGGSSSSNSNWPSPTIATVNNGLTLPLQQGSGSQVESAGFGIYGTVVGLPRCFDIIQKTNYGIPGVVDYILAWPQSGFSGNASEDDYYEGNANGDLYMTFHHIDGSSSGQVGPYTIASASAISGTIGGGLPPGAPGIGFNTNSGNWIYYRCFTNQNGMQLYASASGASSLVLISQISLSQIQGVLGGSYTIDTNVHWMGVASWCSQNVYSQITGTQNRQIGGIQIYS